VIWVVVLAVGAGSFLFRVGPLLALRRTPLGERADRVVRHGGTAAITALIAVSTRRAATGSATVPTLLAAAVGIALAARGASMPRLLACGGGAYAASAMVIALVA
jgi:branched-subunit amino acid transport protein